ncbi:response regulator [Leptothoe spongobia]|uniref:Response regulator n=1 Tax=Leptothoe spongobia TAU-MAC 1115 TaxID=1967444 RepID=A0A947DEN4_9CYAN|nr:response regulator [Leptothoe spongobia]MBT9315530.1 response regulator [Leptothoe spongobia TAU-MAC 1115]
MTKLLLISNEQSCQRLQQEFEGDGYEAVTANRGDEGLILATAASPDLILLDMDVPIVNGWQVIKVLKKARATGLIPVIAIANRTIDGQLLRQAGFDTYVRKPVSVRTLFQRIETLLDNVSVVRKMPSKLSAFSVASMEQAITPPQQQFGHTTVVYVDDRPTHRQAMVEIISRAGYNCVRIPDALQDLSQLLELRPQLIFIDLIMPMANSYGLCAQIRQMSAFKETPIIIVADNDNITERVRARVAGTSGFIRKTDKAQYILEVLIKYLHLSLK